MKTLITLETIGTYIMAIGMVAGGVAIYNGHSAWLFIRVWVIALIITCALRMIERILYE